MPEIEAPPFESPDHWDKAARHYQQTAHIFTSQYAEDALARVTLTPQSHVLDVAAGTGALALAAARTGARIMATDFSPGMVAVFSIFGVIMFPDWRKGLAEMRRVTRPGGYGVVATWQDQGAATFLLLGQIRKKLFPDRVGIAMPQAVKALSNPDDFARELITAGYRDPRIESVTHDYLLDVAALEEPDTLFGMSPDWVSLSDADKTKVIAEVRIMAGDQPELPIASTALIAVAER